MTTENRQFAISICFVLAATLLLAVACTAETPAASVAKPAPQNANSTAQAVETAEFVIGGEKVSNWVSASGTALPHRDSYLSAEVSGKIIEMLAKRGQQVKKGQVLVRLDAEGFRYQSAQAEGAYEVAKSQVAQLERDFARVEKLKADNSIALADHERTKTQLDAARAQLKQAEAAVAMSRHTVAVSEVRAPFDGTVTQVLHEVGEMVTLMPPMPLVRLVDLRSLEIQTYLPENEAAFIKQGRKVEVSIESAAKAVEGEILFVSEQVLPSTQTFEVRIMLPNPNEAIKAGAFARLRLRREWPQGMQFVPLGALGQAADGRRVVRAVTAEGSRDITVKVGPAIEGQVLVDGELSGVTKLAAPLAPVDTASAMNR